MMREHRLYQADWLMRFYGFEAAELTSEAEPELSLAEDPKMAWARRHPEFFPVDVNTAPREALLRVPGIGYKNVDRIVRIRRYQKLALEHLRKLHVQMKNAAAYITASDHLPTGQLLKLAVEPPPVVTSPPVQMDLFAAASALTGAL